MDPFNVVIRAGDPRDSFTVEFDLRSEDDRHVVFLAPVYVSNTLLPALRRRGERLIQVPEDVLDLLDADR